MPGYVQLQNDSLPGYAKVPENHQLLTIKEILKDLKSDFKSKDWNVVTIKTEQTKKKLYSFSYLMLDENYINQKCLFRKDIEDLILNIILRRLIEIYSDLKNQLYTKSNQLEISTLLQETQNVYVEILKIKINTVENEMEMNYGSICGWYYLYQKCVRIKENLDDIPGEFYMLTTLKNKVHHMLLQTIEGRIAKLKDIFKGYKNFGQYGWRQVYYKCNNINNDIKQYLYYDTENLEIEIDHLMRNIGREFMSAKIKYENVIRESKQFIDKYEYNINYFKGSKEELNKINSALNNVKCDLEKSPWYFNNFKSHKKSLMQHLNMLIHTLLEQAILNRIDSVTIYNANDDANNKNIIGCIQYEIEYFKIILKAFFTLHGDSENNAVDEIRNLLDKHRLISTNFAYILRCLESLVAMGMLCSTPNNELENQSRNVFTLISYYMSLILKHSKDQNTAFNSNSIDALLGGVNEYFEQNPMNQQNDRLVNSENRTVDSRAEYDFSTLSTISEETSVEDDSYKTFIQASQYETLYAMSEKNKKVLTEKEHNNAIKSYDSEELESSSSSSDIQNEFKFVRTTPISYQKDDEDKSTLTNIAIEEQNLFEKNINQQPLTNPTVLSDIVEISAEIPNEEQSNYQNPELNLFTEPPNNHTIWSFDEDVLESKKHSSDIQDKLNFVETTPTDVSIKKQKNNNEEASPNHTFLSDVIEISSKVANEKQSKLYNYQDLSHSVFIEPVNQQNNKLVHSEIDSRADYDFSALSTISEETSIEDDLYKTFIKASQYKTLDVLSEENKKLFTEAINNHPISNFDKEVSEELESKNSSSKNQDKVKSTLNQNNDVEEIFALPNVPIEEENIFQKNKEPLHNLAVLSDVIKISTKAANEEQGKLDDFQDPSHNDLSFSPKDIHCVTDTNASNTNIESDTKKEEFQNGQYKNSREALEDSQKMQPIQINPLKAIFNKRKLIKKDVESAEQNLFPDLNTNVNHNILKDEKECEAFMQSEFSENKTTDQEVQLSKNLKIKDDAALKINNTEAVSPVFNTRNNFAEEEMEKIAKRVENVQSRLNHFNGTQQEDEYYKIDEDITSLRVATCYLSASNDDTAIEMKANTLLIVLNNLRDLYEEKCACASPTLNQQEINLKFAEINVIEEDLRKLQNDIESESSDYITLNNSLLKLITEVNNIEDQTEYCVVNAKNQAIKQIQNCIKLLQQNKKQNLNYDIEPSTSDINKINNPEFQIPEKVNYEDAATLKIGSTKNIDPINITKNNFNEEAENLNKIKKIEAEVEKLNSRLNNFNGTKQEDAFYTIDQDITALMVEIDNIASNNNIDIKNQRKTLLNRLNIFSDLYAKKVASAISPLTKDEIGFKLTQINVIEEGLKKVDNDIESGDSDFVTLDNLLLGLLTEVNNVDDKKVDCIVNAKKRVFKKIQNSWRLLAIKYN